MNNRIHLSHGSGKGLADLLDEIILPAMGHNPSAVLEDAAVLAPIAGRLAFTTDSFVVNPIEFPGGDIGKLAACGTINDLAMMGALPRFLSVSLILEEGLETGPLSRVLGSLRSVCVEAGVQVSCGDTKVVERGKADQIFVTTSGIGEIPAIRNITAAGLRPGDAVLVSGPIGKHGIAVMAARQKLGFASSVISDCAPLHGPVKALLEAVPEVRAMRDATRGGIAAVLNELADASKVTIEIEENCIPVTRSVTGACSLMGLDPLTVANEGTFIAIVPEGQADNALKALRSHPLSAEACRIGTAKPRGRFPGLLQTKIGGLRPIMLPPGELLPRIC